MRISRLFINRPALENTLSDWTFVAEMHRYWITIPYSSGNRCFSSQNSKFYLNLTIQYIVSQFVDGVKCFFFVLLFKNARRSLKGQFHNFQIYYFFLYYCVLWHTEFLPLSMILYFQHFPFIQNLKLWISDPEMII